MTLPASSTEGNDPAEAGSVSETDVNDAAPSSEAAEGVQKPTYLESIEAALDGGKEASPASASKGEEQPKPDAEASGADADEGKEGEVADLTEDEIKAYPPNSQRRIRQLVAQRDDERRQTEALKPRAEQFDRIISYMRENSIKPAEFDNALEITALINSGNFSKALEVLTPIYRELAAKAGEVLPTDLAEDVRLGRIDEQRARELSRARAHSSALEQRETRNQERTQAEQQQRQVAEMVSNAARAVDDWAKARAGSDPDWHLKQKDVAEQVELELMRLGASGYPKTKEAAIAIADKALKTVEDRIKAWKPAPQAKRQPNGQFASPHVVTKPKSYMDAINQAIARSE
jgi:hypothetical protein